MVEEKGLQLAQGVDITNVLVIILYLALIVAAAYFLTKYVAKRSLRKGMKQKTGNGRCRTKNELGHMVSVADRIAIDRDKTIVVIEFQGKYYLLGTTAQGLEQIDKVDIPEYEKDSDSIVAKSAEAGQEEPIVTSGPDDTPQEAASNDTFWGRFKKCFSIVVRSYLPKGKNKQDISFSEQLKEKAGKEWKKRGDQ